MGDDRLNQIGKKSVAYQKQEVKDLAKAVLENLDRRKEGDQRVPFKEGDEACVPAIRGHISMLKSYGTITVIAGAYATVQISIGNQKGKWQGLLSELGRRARYKKERRIAIGDRSNRERP